MDLGLPSGTLWADRNLGAKTPREAGLYYQWGESYGHKLSDGYNFSLRSYQEQGLDNISSDLTGDNDAATLYYGNEHIVIPSVDNFKELFNNNNIAMHIVVVNDVNCYEFVSRANGNSIIVPFGGRIDGTSISLETTDGFLWSQQYRSAAQSAAIRMGLSNNPHLINGTRYYGMCIRPVFNP